MSSWINWRIAVVRNGNLSFGAKALGLYLNTYMNDRHDFAFPSLITICAEMRIARATAVKYLAELEEKGMLKKEKRFAKSTVYHVSIPSSSKSELVQDLNHSSSESELTVVQNLNPNKQKNKQCNKQILRARDFDAFWDRYPKRVGKLAAERAWNRLSAKHRSAALEDCADRYAQTSKQFVPNPSTYLNQHRWTDEKISHEDSSRHSGRQSAGQNASDFFNACKTFAASEVDS